MRTVKDLQADMMIENLDRLASREGLTLSGLFAAGEHWQDVVDGDDLHEAWFLWGDIVTADVAQHYKLTRMQRLEDAAGPAVLAPHKGIDAHLPEQALVSSARSVARYVHRNGLSDVKSMRRAVAGKHRKYATMPEVIQYAEKRGWILEADDEMYIPSDGPGLDERTPTRRRPRS